ncbi:DUF3919 family protein [Clostridium botulinum C]|uniref:DUF3919 family protein n=4 Tax=Clostridiaceae TaxID=31979 RepID=A0A9Q4TNG0_CLOBO|nr:DUF3919 family protein [Clostridium botulinum]AYF53595.1 DUF3919 domain-containing protein [Clostridium novyi]EES91246.1 conserved hypothetical protein [Clostridium botulinum D str. 1873]KEI07715.1 hypothetical protein Z957_08310 [Clostridium sp. K25]MCD3194657.1 DUF3919 family protein [Clostridium botulinum C]MCD3200050.1 DUF3919 family protein [Clostridium botulinum C]
MGLIKKNIFLLYILMFFICLSSFIYYKKVIYNKIQIITDSNDNEKTLDNRIPTKMVLYNTKLGSTEINDKFLLNDILKYIRNISNSNTTINTIPTTDNVISISGKIYYMNGETDTFKVNSHLIINNIHFYNNSYLINTLRNMLVDSLYHFNNLINIISKNTNEIVFSNDHIKTILDFKSKCKLIESLKKLKIMSDNKDFLRTNLNEKPKFHLRIYIDKNMENTAENIILLDSYENYIIIQYLGDENGKNIYIKGDLNEKMFK